MPVRHQWKNEPITNLSQVYRYPSKNASQKGSSRNKNPDSMALNDGGSQISEQFSTPFLPNLDDVLPVSPLNQVNKSEEETIEQKIQNSLDASTATTGLESKKEKLGLSRNLIENDDSVRSQG